MPRLELRTFDGRILRLDTHDLELIPLWLIDLLPECCDPAHQIPAELTVYPLPLPTGPGERPRNDWPAPGRTYLLRAEGKLDLLNTMREALALPAYEPRPPGG